MSLDKNKVCNKCPVECKTVRYNKFVNQSGIPKKFDDWVFTNHSSVKLKFDIILYVFYDSLYYTKIEDVAKTKMVDLISKIGGTLGLFIGFNLMNIGELLEFIFLAVSSIIDSKHSKKCIDVV